MGKVTKKGTRTHIDEMGCAIIRRSGRKDHTLAEQKSYTTHRVLLQPIEGYEV